jgi:adhesin transport system membrane fusion protein
MSTTNALRPLEAPPPDPDQGPRSHAIWLTAVLLSFVALAISWAQFAELDVAVQARGSVVPPNKLQEVQSLEGGIVVEMLVVPGDQVKRGQVLARLDTAQVQSDVGESRQQQLAALAGRARTDALLSGSAPHFDEALRREAPGLVDKESQLWRDATREYRSSKAALQEAVERRRGELSETQARIQSVAASIRVAEEAFALEERLFKEGAGSRADYLGAQQRLMQQRTDLESMQNSVPRLRAGLAEAQAQANEQDARFRSQWGAQRSDFESKAALYDQALVGKRDKAARREIVSPIDGVVNRVLVNTRGGVAAAGKPIVEIVPHDLRLQMAARVRPQDIGFIHTGQLAHVRVLPYDASSYGKLNAVVERVGADAINDEKGEPYFEVQLTAARDQLTLHGKPLPINPGMPLDVGILTGQRSVMQYLMKPVFRGVQGALQER